MPSTSIKLLVHARVGRATTGDLIPPFPGLALLPPIRQTEV
jgi:hypothetical protein